MSDPVRGDTNERIPMNDINLPGSTEPGGTVDRKSNFFLFLKWTTQLYTSYFSYKVRRYKYCSMFISKFPHDETFMKVIKIRESEND